MATVDGSLPAVASVGDLLTNIRRSGVLTGRQVDEVRDLAAVGGARDAVALARQLVQRGLLTEFQARLLLHGKTKGLLVGRYVILDRIGAGGMGRVYKARHRLMGRVVALKVISREHLVRPYAVARFLREMRLVGRLDHPNLVRALDADQVGDVPIIVMEYVPGWTLEQRLEAEGPLPPGEVIRYAAQAARGLAHAHTCAVVHRDVKPSNLLLGDDGRLRLLDLGLGALTEIGDDEPEHASFATADGIAVGTVEFMSPEQAAGRPADGRSDLFSLGCTMYHLLTGQVPFPGDSKVECLARRIHGRAVPILDLRPDLPRPLVAVLDRLMATRPEDRYQTGDEAAAALEAIAREVSVPAPAGASRAEFGDPAPAPRSEPAVAPLGSSPNPLPGAGLPPWFRFLMFLAELPPALVLAAAGAALLSAFSAGYALALLRP